jgi:hypothetical protein
MASAGGSSWAADVSFSAATLGVATTACACYCMMHRSACGGASGTGGAGQGRAEGPAASQQQDTQLGQGRVEEVSALSKPSGATAARWAAEQSTLREQLREEDSPTVAAMVAALNGRGAGGKPAAGRNGSDQRWLVAGLDISFVPDNETLAVASVVVVELPSLRQVAQIDMEVTLTEPYIPGFLAFREVSLRRIAEARAASLLTTPHTELLVVAESCAVAGAALCRTAGPPWRSAPRAAATVPADGGRLRHPAPARLWGGEPPRGAAGPALHRRGKRAAAARRPREGWGAEEVRRAAARLWRLARASVRSVDRPNWSC